MCMCVHARLRCAENQCSRCAARKLRPARAYDSLDQFFAGVWTGRACPVFFAELIAFLQGTGPRKGFVVLGEDRLGSHAARAGHLRRLYVAPLLVGRGEIGRVLYGTDRWHGGPRVICVNETWLAPLGLKPGLRDSGLRLGLSNAAPAGRLAPCAVALQLDLEVVFVRRRKTSIPPSTDIVRVLFVSRDPFFPYHLHLPFLSLPPSHIPVVATHVYFFPWRITHMTQIEWLKVPRPGRRPEWHALAERALALW